MGVRLAGWKVKSSSKLLQSPAPSCSYQEKERNACKKVPPKSHLSNTLGIVDLWSHILYIDSASKNLQNVLTHGTGSRYNNYDEHGSKVE